MGFKDELERAKAVVTAGRCPECDVELEGRDLRAHSIQHFGEQLIEERLGAEAKARQAALLGREE